MNLKQTFYRRGFQNLSGRDVDVLGIDLKKRETQRTCLEKVKVVKHKKNGEQHIENHADENDKVEKLRISSWSARFAFYWFIHKYFTAL